MKKLILILFIVLGSQVCFSQVQIVKEKDGIKSYTLKTIDYYRSQDSTIAELKKKLDTIEQAYIKLINDFAILEKTKK